MNKDNDPTLIDELHSQATGQQLIAIRREAKVRYQGEGRRADDSAIAAAILVLEPELARAHFRKAIRRLEEYFETALDLTGPQAARDVIEKVHVITGERRQNHK